MKITGYNQEITNVSGSSSSAPSMSSSVIAKASATQAIDMTPVAKGLNSWADTIQKVQEQEDNENVMRAMDAYNKARFASMYNEKDGLMNKQADGAANIESDYITQEKGYRATILGSTKLHSRAKQAALDDMMNRSAQQGYQQVARHQFQQREKAKDLKLDNNIDNLVKFVQKNWDNPKMINVALEDVNLMTAIRYSGVADSELLKDKAKRKAFAMIVGSAIDSAMQNENYDSAYDYTEKYGQWLTPAQSANAAKVIAAKAKAKWESDFVKNSYAKYGKDVKAFEASLEGATGFSIGKSRGAIPEQAEGATWARMNKDVSLNGLFPKTRRGLDVAAKIYSEIFPGEKLLLTSGTDSTHETHNGESIDVNDDWGRTILADKANRDKFKAALKAQGIRVLDEYEVKTKYQTGPHLHLEFNDFNENGESTKAPMSSEQKDRILKAYMAHVATEDRIKKMSNDQSSDAFSQEVFSWVNSGNVTMEQALAEARKRSGGDKDLMSAYNSIVHLYYNKANGGPGGVGIGGNRGGNGAGKAAASFLIDQGKTMLRNGIFKSQQEYVEYVGDVLGGNLNQVWQARNDYNDFMKSTGEFKFDLGNMVNGALADKYTGEDKLTGANKALIASGVRIYVGKKIAEFRLKNNRDPEMTEVGPMIEEALTTNTFTYQTPNSWGSWLPNSTTEFNLTAAELQSMGINSLMRVPGYDDLYEVRMTNGTTVQMSAARLQALRQGVNTRG